jgi:sugar lactone lactonase YvrE
MRDFWRLGNLGLAAAMLAACALPTGKVPGATKIAQESVVQGGKASPRPRGAASPVLAASPRPGALLSPLPLGAGSPAIAATQAPTGPALVGDKGGSLISDKGGGIIANNGSALSGVVTVPANLLANNGANYRLQAVTTAAAAQAEVALVDAKDQLLPGTDWIKTDAQGRYSFAQVPATGTFYVRARLAAGGKTHQFAAIAKLAGATGTVVDVSPASTLVAEKTRLVADEQDQSADAFSPDKARTLATAAEADLSADKLPDFSQSGKEVAAALDRLIQSDDALEAKARDVDANVGTPIVRAKASAPFASGIFSPEHVAFDARGNLFVVGLNDNTVYTIAAGTTQLKPFATNVLFPHGVACDPQGNVYVSRRIDHHSSTGDVPGQQVYKISPDGKTVTPLNYTFSSPAGLAVSRDGKTLYVADYGGTGQLVAYDLAGDAGKPLGSGMPYANGVAIDSKGLIYVSHLRYDATAKAWIGCLSTVTAAGSVSQFYAGNQDVTGSDMLEGIAIDAADNLYVSNNWGDTIFKFTPKQKKIETFLKFNQPTGLAFDPQGNLVVADYDLGTLSLVTP